MAPPRPTSAADKQLCVHDIVKHTETIGTKALCFDRQGDIGSGVRAAGVVRLFDPKAPIFGINVRVPARARGGEAARLRNRNVRTETS